MAIPTMILVFVIIAINARSDVLHVAVAIATTARSLSATDRCATIKTLAGYFSRLAVNRTAVHVGLAGERLLAVGGDQRRAQHR